MKKIIIVLILIGIKCQAQNVSDVDGNTYKTIILGSQTWMAENLKTTKYRNGNSINTTTSKNQNISSESAPKYQWAYNGIDSLVDVYGRLYTWYTVVDSRKLCPSGWHVPTENEWSLLIEFMHNIEGSRLKEAGTNHWTEFNFDTKNESQPPSGFNALPGGERTLKGEFYELNRFGFWWTSTIIDDKKSPLAYYKRMENSSRFVYTDFEKMGFGLSVRCIKDNK